MSAVFIARGDYQPRRTRRDKNGNMVEQTRAKWELNAEGGCVAICDMDPDKMELVGAAEVYGDWDAAQFLSRVLEKLGPGRPTNIPNFRSILKKAMDDGSSEDFFCDYCEQCGYSCQDCIVTEWTDEIRNMG